MRPHFVLIGLLLGGGTAHAAEFVVNSLNVVGDSYLNDGLCDTSARPDLEPPIEPSGLCTLRAALDQAATTPEVDTITFALDGEVPTLLSAQIDVDTPVVLRGDTGGARRVQIGAGVNEGRVRVTAPGVELHALVVGGLGIAIEADDVLVRDCYIGLTPDGTDRLGRGDINLSGARANIRVEHNVIAQRIRGQGDQNRDVVVRGNLIGADVSGAQVVNFGAEIELFGQGIEIGGPDEADRNVVLGRVNVGGEGVRVRNLHLGVDLAGTRALNNNAFLDVGGVDAWIGGVEPGDRNVIVGGLRLTGGGHRVQGNALGVDRAGMAALGALTFGAQIGATDVLFGGPRPEGVEGCAGPCNVVAGLGGDFPAGTGLIIEDVPPGAFGVRVEGNHFGVAADGRTPLPINRDAVRVRGFVDDVTLGGPDAAQANLFGAVGRHAIYVDAAVVPQDGDPRRLRIEGNTFGVDADGAPLGVGDDVVRTEATELTLEVVDNTLQAGGGHGLRLDGLPQAPHRVTGNRIGGAAIGLGNARSGLRLNAADAEVEVTGNAFVGNGGTGALNGGLHVLGGVARALDNTFARHGGSDGSVARAIVLGDNPAPPPNDAGDGDAGPNGLRNFPVLTEVVREDDTVFVRGTIDGPAGTATIQLFANAVCHPSGHGEAEGIVGQLDIFVPGAARAFEARLEGVEAAGEVFTATATGPGGTSELSACLGGGAVECCDGPDGVFRVPAGTCPGVVVDPATCVGDLGDVCCDTADGLQTLGRGACADASGEIVTLADCALPVCCDLPEGPGFARTDACESPLDAFRCEALEPVCCDTDGALSRVPAADCAGATVDDAVCDIGVCCRTADGDAQSTALACEVAGGDVVGATCDDVNVCCDRQGYPETIGRSACAIAAGEELPAAVCAASLCCAFDDGARSARADACEAAGGAPADPARCDDTPVCCATAEGPRDLSRAVCAEAEGDEMPRATCDAMVCCVTEAGAEVVRVADCAGEQGDEAACNADPACCLLGGVLRTQGEGACLRAGGVVQPEDTCAAPVCCVFADATRETRADACDAEGGAPADDPAVCAPAEVCCAEGARRRVRTDAACAADGGAAVDAALCAAEVCCQTPDGDETRTAAECGALDAPSTPGACAPPEETLCCLTGDVLSTTTFEACADGGGAQAAEDACARPVCCAEGAGSLLRRADACRSAGFAEDAPFACERRVCCEIEGATSIRDAVACAADEGQPTDADSCPICCDGVALRDATECAAAGGQATALADCDTAPPVCCDRQGFPERVSPELCAAAPDAEALDEAACEAMVCCQRDETVTLVGPGECVAPGAEVDPGLCDPRGVCCALEGGVARVPFEDCAEPADDQATCDAPVCCAVETGFAVRPADSCEAPVEAANCRICCVAGGAATPSEVDDCAGEVQPIAACAAVCCAGEDGPAEVPGALCDAPLETAECAGSGLADGGVGGLDGAAGGVTGGDDTGGCDCDAADADGGAAGLVLMLLMLLPARRRRRARSLSE